MDKEDFIIQVLVKHQEDFSDGYSFYGTEVTEEIYRKVAKEILAGMDAIKDEKCE